MDPKALEHVRKRLEKATAAVSALENSTSLDEAEEAWSDFLATASTIYSKLEQGSKTSGPSAGWFGRKKKERKDDELLSYLHHARNSDEHGIADITRRKPGGWGIAGGGKYRIDGVIGPQTDLRVTHLGGEPPRLIVDRPSIQLIPVTDNRYGDTFSPPTRHMGTALADISPLAIAKLGHTYLKRLLEEAAGLLP
jgi:hypothetical protein